MSTDSNSCLGSINTHKKGELKQPHSGK